MAATAKKITVAASKDAANLQTIFAKMKNIYFSSTPITEAVLKNSGIECDFELPVISDGVTLNTGDADVSETKLTTGSIWTSRADKGDSDISFQVASIAGTINDKFMVKKTGTTAVSGIEIAGLDGTFSVASYGLEVKKVTGALVMTDDNGQTVLVLTNVEIYASFVAADGDNPAYFNLSVTPKANTDGAEIMILTRDSKSVDNIVG